MSLTVLHAPLRAPEARKHPRVVLREVRKHEATMVGLTEAYNLLPQLSRMPNYRLVMEAGGADQMRGQKDTPILVLRGLRSLGSGQVFGCDRSSPTNIAPERWLTFSAVTVPDVGNVCHIVLHPHAAVQDLPSGKLRTNHDRGRQFGRQMEVLESLLTFATAMKWLVVVTGDLNFRDEGADPLSPYTILRAHSLKLSAHGIDCIAFSRKLKLEVTEVAAPSTITDHPWLLGVGP